MTGFLQTLQPLPDERLYATWNRLESELESLKDRHSTDGVELGVHNMEFQSRCG